MKHWKVRHSNCKEMCLLNGDRVVSIGIDSSNKVTFTEECNSFFSITFTKEEAIEILKEAICWIEKDGGNVCHS